MIVGALLLVLVSVVGALQVRQDDRLNERGIVELDEERKAAMVSNLLVVLCADQPASPVVNTGTLYS